MNNVLRLHRENLALFLEPAFKRQTLGFYSINKAEKYITDDSEKTTLVALKESMRSSQGTVDYEVPTYLSEKDLTQGYEQYNDEGDMDRHEDLLRWYDSHLKECAGVDVLCSSKVVAKVLKAPFAEAASRPWEVKVTRANHNVCLLVEDESMRERYSDMDRAGQQRLYRERSFQNYMTVKKAVSDHTKAPTDHNQKFYRVTKVELDSGILIYQCELHCFDKNYKSLEVKVMRDGQYDLPGPAARLEWWADSFLSGSNAIICGYYDDENLVSRITSFEAKNMKPKKIRDEPFDEELCVAALCTFIEYIKALLQDGRISSCTLRFEPASKRVCALDIITRDPSAILIKQPEGLKTQLSTTDEVSSVETTPRDTNFDGSFTADDLTAGFNEYAMVRRRTTAQTGGNSTAVKAIENTAGLQMNQIGPDDDDDKYGIKPAGRKKTQEDPNWLHVGIVFSFIAFCLLWIPYAFQNGILGMR